MIASYLPKTQDVMNLRLTSRALGCAGLPHLLPHVSVAMLPESLKRLEEISEHPTLNAYVRTISFGVDLVAPFSDVTEFDLSKSGYERRLLGRLDQSTGFPVEESTPFHDETDGSDYSDFDESSLVDNTLIRYSRSNLARLPLNYDQQGSRCHEQQVMLEVDEFGNQIRLAVSRLRNVHTIVLSSFSSARPWPSWLPKQSLDCIFHFSINNEDCLSLAATILESAFEGAILGKLNLRSVVANTMPLSFFSNQIDYSRYRQLLSSLEHIRLHVQDDPNIQTYRDPCGTMPKKLIRELQNAKTIKIVNTAQMPLIPRARRYPLRLNDFFGDQVYPKLRVLRLERITTDQESIIHFFAQHADTLKSLSLNGVTLVESEKYTGCNWLDVFTLLRDGLQLDSFYFSSELLSEEPRRCLTANDVVGFVSDVQVNQALRHQLCNHNYGFLCDQPTLEDIFYQETYF